jgi:hypothetical protein
MWRGARRPRGGLAAPPYGKPAPVSAAASAGARAQTFALRSFSRCRETMGESGACGEAGQCGDDLSPHPPRIGRSIPRRACTNRTRRKRPHAGVRTMAALCVRRSTHRHVGDGLSRPITMAKRHTKRSAPKRKDHPTRKPKVVAKKGLPRRSDGRGRSSRRRAISPSPRSPSRRPAAATGAHGGAQSQCGGTQTRTMCSDPWRSSCSAAGGIRSQLLERQSIRRMEAGHPYRPAGRGRGRALMQLEETVRDIAAKFGIRRRSQP